MGTMTSRMLAYIVGNQDQEGEEGNGIGTSSTSFFTCGICMETMSIVKKFMNKKCSHPYCWDCISQHIHYKVYHSKMAQVHCPFPTCSKLLDPLSCRSILTGLTFSRWCDVIFETMAAEWPKAYCPFKDCSVMVVDECGGGGGRSKVKKVKCPRCRRHFCFQCNVPWHAGYGCKDSKMNKDRGDAVFWKFAKWNGWQRCPKCKTCVERASGCSHIICRCKCTFCYKCGSNYNTRHHRFFCPLRAMTWRILS